MKEVERIYPIGRVLTPQEHQLIGSTPDEEAIRIGGWHKPQPLSTDELTKDEINARREKERFVLMGLGMRQFFDVSNDEKLGLSLETLDEDGTTVRDPQIIAGKWDPETRQIDGRDISNEFYTRFKEFGIELHLRERTNSSIEGNYKPGIERE